MLAGASGNIMLRGDCTSRVEDLKTWVVALKPGPRFRTLLKQNQLCLLKLTGNQALISTTPDLIWRGVVKTEVISSTIDIPPSPYLHNIFLKWGKTNHTSAFHRVCEQLSVYPGLQMHCYLRVGIPLHPSHPGRGSWERGPEADLEWRGHKQLCASSTQSRTMTEINTAL